MSFSQSDRRRTVVQSTQTDFPMWFLSHRLIRHGLDALRIFRKNRAEAIRMVCFFFSGNRFASFSSSTIFPAWNSSCRRAEEQAEPLARFKRKRWVVSETLPITRANSSRERAKSPVTPSRDAIPDDRFAKYFSARWIIIYKVWPVVVVTTVSIIKSWKQTFEQKERTKKNRDESSEKTHDSQQSFRVLNSIDCPTAATTWRDAQLITNLFYQKSQYVINIELFIGVFVAGDGALVLLPDSPYDSLSIAADRRWRRLCTCCNWHRHNSEYLLIKKPWRMLIRMGGTPPHRTQRHNGNAALARSTVPDALLLLLPATTSVAVVVVAVLVVVVTLIKTNCIDLLWK